jgi:hypothetical protein
VEETTVMICVVLSITACDVDLTNLRALVSSTPNVDDVDLTNLRALVSSTPDVDGDVLVQAIK